MLRLIAIYANLCGEFVQGIKVKHKQVCVNLCSNQLHFILIYVVKRLKLKKSENKFMLRSIAIYAHLCGKYA